MFGFEHGSSTKSSKKPSRCRLLVDRATGHRNDENVMPQAQQQHAGSGAGSGVGCKITTPLQTKSFLQTQVAPALPAPPAAALAPPPITPRPDVRVGAMTQIIENLEFKRRLKELENVARGAEQENARLQRLLKQAQDAATSANARAAEENIRASAEKKRADDARAEVQRAFAQVEAESVRAGAEKKRADDARAEVQRSFAQVEAESARAGAEKKRADQAMVEVKTAVTLAEAERARAMVEKQRADGAVTAATQAMVEVKTAVTLAEAERARAMVEKQRADGAVTAATAARDEVRVARDEAEVVIGQAKVAVAKEKAIVEEVSSKMSLLRQNIKTLATHVLERYPAKVNPVTQKERDAGCRANLGSAVEVLVSSTQLSDTENKGGDDGAAARMKFIQGFCELVETATGQELPHDALEHLLEVRWSSPPPPGEKDCDPDDALKPGPLQGATGEVNVTISPEAPASAPAAEPAAASNLAVTTASGRSTAIRREQVRARRAQKERDARRIEEEQLREKAERCNSRKKRKKELMAEKARIAGKDTCVDGGRGVSHQGSTSKLAGLEAEQQQQSEKEPRAQQFKSKRAKLGDSTPPQSSRRRQQQRAQKPRGHSVDIGDSKGFATYPPVTASASMVTERKAAEKGGSKRSLTGAAPEARPATCGEHVEATVEEVPMPTGSMDDALFYSVAMRTETSGSETPANDKGRRTVAKADAEYSEGMIVGDEGAVEAVADGALKLGKVVPKKASAGRRRTRSMSGMNRKGICLWVETPERLDDRSRNATPASKVTELALAEQLSSENRPRKVTASPGVTSKARPLASCTLSSPTSSCKGGDKATYVAAIAEGRTMPPAATPRREAATPRREAAKFVTPGARFGVGKKIPRSGAPTLLSVGAVPNIVLSGGITIRQGSFTRGTRRIYNTVTVTGTDGGSKNFERVGTRRLALEPSLPLLPFGDDDAGGVDQRGITAAAKAWLDKPAAEGPGGVLTGVLAAAQVLMQKHAQKISGREPRFLMQTEVVQRLRSLVTAIAAAESCAMKHEARARAVAVSVASMDSPPSSGSGGGGDKCARAAGKGRLTTAVGAGGARKRVKFCAFDLSTVDMPCEAIQDSEVPAKEVADCLTRVVDASGLLQKALQKAAPRQGRGPTAAVRQESFTMWRAFLRGVRTVSVAPAASSPLVEAVKTACLGMGGEASADTVKGAAVLLLDELLPLERDEAPVNSPLRMRLAGFLSALIRFNLRVLLNPPPPKSSGVSLYSTLRFGANHSKVHEVIELTTDGIKNKKRDDYNPTRDGATSAAVSRALRRLYGYSDEKALGVIKEAEAFVEEVETGDSLSAGEVALRARQHSLDTVDVVAAIRARGFMVELLSFSGVEEAIAEAQGWGEIERLSATLQKVRDCPDADAALSLLADVQGLKGWLGTASPWRHVEQAKAVLTKLDKVMVACDKKEAKRLSQEARRRMWFPRVKVASLPGTAATS